MRSLTIDTLTRDHLESLLMGDVAVVRCPDFLPSSEMEGFCDRINGSQLKGSYDNAPDILRVGRAYFEKQSGPDAARDYEDNALEWINRMRQLVSPLRLPMDVLHLILDELWPTGATLATLDGWRAFFGLVRVFEPGAAAEPHMDVLAWDAPEGSPAIQLSAQLAANIYHQMPVQGGELCIWPISFSKPEYENARREGSYGLRPEAIGNPELIISPSPGELVLFNSRLVHSVNGGQGGDRVTSSCFIGQRNSSDALWLWS